MTPLTPDELALLREARRAVLSTVAPDGAPRPVPIAFVFDADVLYTALDEKPKSVMDPRDLARVRDIVARPRVAVLVDRWSEDWSQLGWLRLTGLARLVEHGADDRVGADHARAVGLLRANYAQYASQALEGRPLIRIDLDGHTSWFAR